MTTDIKTHTSLTRMLTESVRAHPERVFLRDAEGDLSYRETHDRVARLAGGLAVHGLGVGESVALIMHNSLDQVLTWFALARIGAIHAPVNTALVGDRLRHVLATSGATTLVIDEAFADAVIQVLPTLPGIRRVIVRNGASVTSAPNWPDELPAIDLGELAVCEDPHAVVERDDLAPATLLFTSGTTGLSKACVLSDRYLARQGQIHAREFRFTPADVLYSPFPLFHIDTATLTILAALAAGCTAAIGNRFSASRFWDEVRRFDASVFNFMGATLTILWKREPTADDRRHRVRMAWGVPMPDWQPGWEDRFNIPLFQVYGSTDAGVPVYDPLDGSQRRGTCGRVLDEFEVVIRGSHFTPDVPGEILVRGREPGITMNGYHGMAAETSEVIDQDGWVHTGDIGAIDADGFLSFHGRLSDSIRRRGENISAYEVEQMLVAHRDVLEAAAVAVPSELTEDDVKACVVLRGGSNLLPAELHAFCLGRAPRFMVPRYIEIRASLPKTPTEKVEKFKLRSPAGSILSWDSESAWLDPETRPAGRSQESRQALMEQGDKAAAGIWSSGVAFIDGDFCPIEDAKISVLDLGVTRSDSTYDVAHVWRGRFYRLDAHLDRFHAGMSALRLKAGYDRRQLEKVLHECVSRSGLQDAYVSMTCTRGRTAPGTRDLRTARNTFYCFAIPFVWINTPSQQESGASLWISKTARIPPESVDSRVKNYHWLDLDRAQLDAYDSGAELVVLRDLSGAITEGPGYNIFAYRRGRWLTPGHGVLQGVTRRSVIEIVQEEGMAVEEGQMSADYLRSASEVFVTSTAGGVMPVTMVDRQPVGSGRPGPLWLQISRRYWARHDDPRWSTAVRYSKPQE